MSIHGQQTKYKMPQAALPISKLEKDLLKIKAAVWDLLRVSMYDLLKMVQWKQTIIEE